jgi:hypothetical protein
MRPWSYGNQISRSRLSTIHNRKCLRKKHKQGTVNFLRCCAPCRLKMSSGSLGCHALPVTNFQDRDKNMGE